MTYRKRLQAFLAQAPDRALGFVTWYGATGSSVRESEHCLTGEKLLYLETVGDRLPNLLKFSQQALAEYFLPGEDVPCFMPGSIYGLSQKWKIVGARQCYWAEAVFDRQIARWLRKRRITALTRKEFEGIVARGFWEKQAHHLEERYGSGRESILYHCLDHLVDLIDSEMGGWVLVEGRRVMCDKEKLEALQAMHGLERKLRIAA